jgi:uncharacterized RDD family membrane protein YckC
MDSDNLHKHVAAGFLRRMTAAIYDWLLVIALMMIVSTPVVALLDDAISPANPFYQAAMLLVAAAFFAGFWSHGGQTLGMKAWRLRLRRRDGSPVTLGRAGLRFVYAAIALLAAGLGFVWMLWDKDSLTWHDRWTDTTIELLPKAQQGKQVR